MRKLGWILGMLALAACTDTEMAAFSAYGEPAIVLCYSGGKEIYRGKSTGKLHTENRSDGWLFKEAGTGYLIRVSGACVIRQQTDSSVKLPSLPPQE